MHCKALCHTIFLFLFTVLAFGCGTDQKLLNAYRKSRVFDGIADTLDLNHTYQNISPPKSIALMPELIFNYDQSWRGRHIHDSAGIILKYDNAKRLSVHFASVDTVFDYSFKVKNKGNYLILKRSVIMV